ncbi:hypothetical protein EDB85DRAFT_1899527 [Lactarius pseudohatsudake]|nr:hypothetical protein EDB85DRAFT_1899527 [Lactarius pseudohatsudake]
MTSHFPSERLLNKRLRDIVDTDGGVGPEYHPRSDSARLQNIVRFLADIRDMLRDMKHAVVGVQRCGFEQYRNGHGTFDQQGNRGSPAFVPAAQQDLIVLTLEILARDPVANVATSRGDAFRDAYTKFVHVALEQARARAQTQALPQSHSELETVARIRTHAGNSLEMFERALGPVLESLPLRTGEMPTSLTPQVPPHMPESLVVSAPAHVGSIQKSSPEQIQAMDSLPYSTASSSA